MGLPRCPKCNGQVLGKGEPVCIQCGFRPKGFIEEPIDKTPRRSIRSTDDSSYWNSSGKWIMTSGRRD